MLLVHLLIITYYYYHHRVLYSTTTWVEYPKYYPYSSQLHYVSLLKLKSCYCFAMLVILEEIYLFFRDSHNVVGFVVPVWSNVEVHKLYLAQVITLCEILHCFSPCHCDPWVFLQMKKIKLICKIYCLDLSKKITSKSNYAENGYTSSYA